MSLPVVCCLSCALVCALGTVECWGGRQGGCGPELCVRRLRVCGSQLAVCLVSLFVSVCRSCVSSSSVQRPPIPRWCPVRAWLFFTLLQYTHRCVCDLCVVSVVRVSRFWCPAISACLASRGPAHPGYPSRGTHWVALSRARRGSAPRDLESACVCLYSPGLAVCSTSLLRPDASLMLRCESRPL